MKNSSKKPAAPQATPEVVVTSAPEAAVPTTSGEASEQEIKIANLGKYAKTHARVFENKPATEMLCSPGFKFADKMITVGKHLPRENSVKGKIRAFVAKNGPIRGRELVHRLFLEVNFQDQHRSQYVKGGRPTKAWIEGYVAGGINKDGERFLEVAK